MKQLILTALVAVMLVMGSAAFAQGTLTGTPTCAGSNLPVPDGAAVVGTDANGDTTYTFAGQDGRDGRDGQDGYNGQNGQNGANGYNGTNGQDGRGGHHGRNGQNGRNGKDGKDGKDGRDGRDGFNIVTVPASTTTGSGAAGEEGPSMWSILGFIIAIAVFITLATALISWLSRLGKTADQNNAYNHVAPHRAAMGVQNPPAFANKAKGSGWTSQFDAQGRMIGFERWETEDMAPAALPQPQPYGVALPPAHWQQQQQPLQQQWWQQQALPAPANNPPANSNQVVAAPAVVFNNDAWNALVNAPGSTVNFNPQQPPPNP